MTIIFEKEPPLYIGQQLKFIMNQLSKKDLPSNAKEVFESLHADLFKLESIFFQLLSLEKALKLMNRLFVLSMENVEEAEGISGIFKALQAELETINKGLDDILFNKPKKGG